MGIPQGSVLETEKYHVIRELGRGGMGVVYLAEDRLLQRQVALKVLYDHLNRDDAFVKRFQEEARSVSTLHHPHIVCVHGLERSGERIAIDMEFVPGQSLDRFRQVTELNTHIVAGIACDVLSGLATCHAIGVVHRDIKPSNILITEDSRAKITDFGLATAYASHLEATIRGNTSSGFYMGTPRYMPVEAWEGGLPKPHWDLYAFGVVVFELLSGRIAFEGDNPMAIMRMQLTEPLPPLHTIAPGVSAEMSALVAALLGSGEQDAITAADAQDLLQNTPEFQDLHDSNVSATISLPKPVAPKKTRPRQQPRTSLTRANLGLLGIVVVAAAFLWAAGRNSAPKPLAANPAKPAAGSGLVAPSFPAGNDPVYLEVRAVDNDSFGSGTWMVERNAQGAPSKITGFTTLGLWVMDVSPPGGGVEGAWPVTGSWAAMLSAQNQIAHFGYLKGSLAWDADNGGMVLSMVRTRERDRDAIKFSVYGRSKSTQYDPQRFFYELEANTILQTLIYGELLGRAQDWATNLEARLPALPRGRVTVPSIPGPIVVDGILSESTWANGAFDSSGRVGEVSLPDGSPNAPLLVRWAGDAVYFATRVGAAGQAPVFELGVLPALETSLEHTGRFFVHLDAAGALTGQYRLGTVEQAWQCTWESGVTMENGVISVELRIPLDELEERARPTDQKRWRISARLTRETAAGERELRARWGDLDFESLPHGVLLVFRGNAP